MAQYYFDLKNGTTERDHIGLDLATDDAAIARAHAIADEVSARPPANNAHDRYVCIIHENGHEVQRVRVVRPVASAPRLKKSSQ